MVQHFMAFLYLFHDLGWSSLRMLKCLDNFPHQFFQPAHAQVANKIYHLYLVLSCVRCLLVSTVFSKFKLHFSFVVEKCSVFALLGNSSINLIENYFIGDFQISPEGSFR